MLGNRVSLSMYVSRRRTEWSSPSTGVPAANAFNQPGAIATRLSESWSTGMRYREAR